jgi:hypothetical protein
MLKKKTLLTSAGDQGYTTMHGQPIIKICNAKQARHLQLKVTCRGKQCFF